MGRLCGGAHEISGIKVQKLSLGVKKKSLPTQMDLYDPYYGSLQYSIRVL